MKQLLFILLATTILFSCNTSTRSNWSELDKNLTREQLNEELDSSYEAEHLTIGEKNAYLDCVIRKLEQEYNSPREADKDLYGIETLCVECVNEINANGSKTGNWSSSDIQKFKNEISLTKDIFIEQNLDMAKFYPFLISKFENNFSSYYEMNKSQKLVETIMTESMIEFRANGSKKGYWSKSDREKLEKDVYLTKDILISSGINPRKFTECLINKFELIYNSYYDANQDINGFQKIYQSCIFKK